MKSSFDVWSAVQMRQMAQWNFWGIFVLKIFTTFKTFRKIFWQITIRLSVLLDAKTNKINWELSVLCLIFFSLVFSPRSLPKGHSSTALLDRQPITTTHKKNSKKSYSVSLKIFARKRDYIAKRGLYEDHVLLIRFSLFSVAWCVKSVQSPLWPSRVQANLFCREAKDEVRWSWHEPKSPLVNGCAHRKKKFCESN